MLACPCFVTTRHSEPLQNSLLPYTLYEEIHKIVQYLSAVHTFETWVKHCYGVVSVPAAMLIALTDISLTHMFVNIY